jgi:hypothetical protein
MNATGRVTLGDLIREGKLLWVEAGAADGRNLFR